MGKILIPTKTAEDWRCLLADPNKHWRVGYSARSLAHCWQAASGFPAEVQRVLESNKAFPGLQLLLAIPEVKTSLPGGARPTQTDLWVLARCDSGLVGIAVEGKAAEPFGPTLGQWLADEPGKRRRLQFLLETLGLCSTPELDIRYQLLHRTAAAVLEAQRFCARHAVMLVHSFGPAHDSVHDFRAFAALFGVAASPGELMAVGERGGVSLHIGWAVGEDRFLAS